jgi:hypothetical protein
VRLGATRVGGVDLDKRACARRWPTWRCRRPTGSLSPSFAAKVHSRTRAHAYRLQRPPLGYNLRKLREHLVGKPGRTRRDIRAPLAASTVAARLTLRDQAIAPILAAVCSPCMGRKPAHGTRVDHDYQRLCIDM